MCDSRLERGRLRIGVASRWMDAKANRNVVESSDCDGRTLVFGGESLCESAWSVHVASTLDELMPLE